MGMTQYKLADEIGLTRSGYSLIELGLCNPSLKTARKIAKVLETTIEDIM